MKLLFILIGSLLLSACSLNSDTDEAIFQSIHQIDYLYINEANIYQKDISVDLVRDGRIYQGDFESDFLTINIINNTKQTLELSEGFSIEKYVDSNWETVLEETDADDVIHTVSPGNSIVLNTSFQDLDLNSGTYRVTNLTCAIGYLFTISEFPAE